MGLTVAAVDAGAQPTADIAITAVTAGQCAVTVTVSNPAAHPSSEIDLDLNGLRRAAGELAREPHGLGCYQFVEHRHGVPCAGSRARLRARTVMDETRHA